MGYTPFRGLAKRDRQLSVSFSLNDQISTLLIFILYKLYRIASISQLLLSKPEIKYLNLSFLSMATCSLFIRKKFAFSKLFSEKMKYLQKKKQFFVERSNQQRYQNIDELQGNKLLDCEFQLKDVFFQLLNRF